MIMSVHAADVGAGATVGLVRRGVAVADVPGLRYAVTTFTAPLGAGFLPRPRPGRVGLVAAWDDDAALDGFLATHPLAARIARGWHLRLRPMRVVGAWPALDGLPREQLAMRPEEPVAVLTIGRLRLGQAVRFLRASAAAEGVAVADPALLASTGLARPPGLVATFSLWRATDAMREYALGAHRPQHRDAVQAHSARPFHHESAFIRFRPYDARGSWGGRQLETVLSAAAPAR